MFKLVGRIQKREETCSSWGCEMLDHPRRSEGQFDVGESRRGRGKDVLEKVVWNEDGEGNRAQSLKMNATTIAGYQHQLISESPRDCTDMM